MEGCIFEGLMRENGIKRQHRKSEICFCSSDCFGPGDTENFKNHYMNLTVLHLVPHLSQCSFQKPNDQRCHIKKKTKAQPEKVTADMSCIRDEDGNR